MCDVLYIQCKWAEWQYTALTYSFPNFEPVCCSMSSSNCCFLTCVQVSHKADKMYYYPIYLRIFWFVVIHTFKGFSVVSEAEVDAFLEFPCFFCDPMHVENLISGSSASFKSSMPGLPCPSPTPWVHPNPSPLSQWCHPTNSSSVIPFSSCLQSFPASGSLFQWVSSSYQMAKVLEFQSFLSIFRTDFL